ncbi:pyroglutamyl-peptidase I [Ruania zhangjianzhongii]|uniref:pyroglutamyl-peptidase I family protein n=1 Tax=Ruania zhangjianzhongii TaxID=2603206 RepID=UPI0011C9F38E|nr:pyroglutamyl-peptidase I [Ruania zhangjianzhongii]
MAATVLLTGFEPFDGRAGNPSIEVVRALARDWAGPERLVVAELPVAYTRAGECLAELLEATDPAVALGVGLAAGRTRLSLERLAVNLCDARIPDNDGYQPDAAPVVPGGPTALWSNLPVKRMVTAAEAAGCPAELSMTAGTYVCNAVFYHLARWAAADDRGAGFAHVPDPQTLPVAQTTAGLAAGLRTALDHTTDLRRPVGAVS